VFVRSLSATLAAPRAPSGNTALVYLCLRFPLSPAWGVAQYSSQLIPVRVPPGCCSSRTLATRTQEGDALSFPPKGQEHTRRRVSPAWRHSFGFCRFGFPPSTVTFPCHFLQFHVNESHHAMFDGSSLNLICVQSQRRFRALCVCHPLLAPSVLPASPPFNKGAIG
jgi:hypothetical protein